jgi:glycosyltransferase involved in cell wall biosynthesis
MSNPDSTPPPSRAPAVTIALAARNAERTLALTLRSVVQQTFADWELLLIDDGSTDGTRAVAEAVAAQRASAGRIRIDSDGRTLGLAARLNQAIDGARGRYLARLDADDVAFPERLQLQVDYLDQHPQIDLLGGGAIVFGDDGQAFGRYPIALAHADICRRPWSGFYLAHPTWMGRIEWFRRFRYRAEMNRGAQDRELLLRSWRSSTFANLPNLLIGYRQQQLDGLKFARSRVQFVRAALRQAWREGAWGAMVSVPAIQFARAAYEAMAIGAGLGRPLLRHRARPLADQDAAAWAQCWRALQVEHG